MWWVAAEAGRVHAAKVLSSQLSEFLALTATSLMDEGTLDAQARLAARRAFDEFAPLDWLALRSQ